MKKQENFNSDSYPDALTAQKLFQQAKSYSIKDKYDEADGLAQKAILLYKKCEVLKNELVDQLYEVEKDELAEQLNREFKISYANLLFFTGLNLSKKDDSEYENACKYYQQAINMHPDRCTPYMNKHQDFIKSMEDVIKHIANTKSDNKELDISNIKLTGSEIKYSIAPQIENNVGNFKNIEKLVVSWSKLGDSGATAFSKIIELFLPALKHADFTGNGISTYGIQHLAPALKKAKVETIRLPVNNLNEDSAPYVSFMVEDNKVLSVLHLFANELRKGVAQVQQAAKTAPKLYALTFQDNKMDVDDASDLILSNSPQLKSFCLGANSLDLTKSH